MPAKRKTSPNGNDGFTLVELLMAMLVMTVGLLGLLQSVNVAYEHSVRTRLRESAVLVGEEQMKLLRRTTPEASPAFLHRSSVVRLIAGGTKKFSIVKECQPLGRSNRLRVTVGWSFKNVSTSHTIYTLKSS